MTAAYTVKSFSTVDRDTCWYSVNTDKVTTPMQAEQVEKAFISMARQERVKAIVWTGVGAGVAFLMAEIGYIAFTVSYVASYLFFLPLIFVPPLYKLAILCTSGAVGIGTGFLGVKKFAVPFFANGNKSWTYATHLYAQAEIAAKRFPKIST